MDNLDIDLAKLQKLESTNGNISKSKNSDYSWYVFISIFSLFILILILFWPFQTSITSNNSLLSTEASSCLNCEVAVLPTTSLSGGSGGIKRALLIGCNYNFPGSACLTYDCTLNGCIQDVQNISRVLTTRLGYQSSNVKIMVDNGTTQMPTKANIIQELNFLIQSMSSGDSSFIWFSGHGSQLPSSSAEGGYNECWCPPDTIENGLYLIDDVLSAIVRQAPSQSNVFIGSDSCHSGTVFDLRYILQEPDGTHANRDISDTTKRSLDLIRGRKQMNQTFFEARIAKLRSTKHIQSQDQTRSNLSTEIRSSSSPMIVIQDLIYPDSSANIVALSGCQDYDTSADGFENGQSQGAMSWAFEACFDPNISLTSLLRNMRKKLSQSGYYQVPQITTGILINPNITSLRQIL